MATDISSDLLSAIHENPATASELILNLVLPHVQSAVKSAVPAAIDERLQVVGFNEEILGLASLLAAKSQDPKNEVFRKALTLYGLALDALERGNRLAIIDSEDMIVHDVIGFEPDDLLVDYTTSRDDPVPWQNRV